MKICILAPDTRAEAAARLCAEFCGTLCRHDVHASLEAAELISRTSGFSPESLFEYSRGAIEQALSRVENREAGLVILLRDPLDRAQDPLIAELVSVCDGAGVPVATGMATAEALLRSLSRGDLGGTSRKKMIIR